MGVLSEEEVIFCIELKWVEEGICSVPGILRNWRLERVLNREKFFSR